MNTFDEIKVSIEKFFDVKYSIDNFEYKSQLQEVFELFDEYYNGAETLAENVVEFIEHDLSDFNYDLLSETEEYKFWQVVDECVNDHKEYLLDSSDSLEDDTENDYYDEDGNLYGDD